MNERAYDSEHDDVPSLGIVVSHGGTVTYSVNGVEVARDDYNAIVAAHGVFAALRIETEIERLADYLQQLDPDIDDTFGRRVVEKLQLIAECVEQ